MYFLEMTSSNECTTDDNPGGEDQSNSFLPSDSNVEPTPSSNLGEMVFEPPANGKFIDSYIF